MAWIESHSILIEHPKLREVSRLLGIEPAHFLGHLHCLWHKVIELREDGDISSWSEGDISYYARWQGDAKIFYDALKNRFIDEKNEKKLIHDWYDYAGKYLHAKYHTNNPKLLKTIKKMYNKTGKPKGYTKGHTKYHLPNLTNLTNLTEPNQTLPNLTNLPDWIPKEAWDGFVEMRKKAKSPFTERALNLAISELDKLRSQGQDPAAVLNQSVMNGWKGLFPIKLQEAQNGKHTGLTKKDYAKGLDDF